LAFVKKEERKKCVFDGEERRWREGTDEFKGKGAN